MPHYIHPRDSYRRYNKVLPVLFGTEVSSMYMARYYQELAEVGGVVMLALLPFHNIAWERNQYVAKIVSFQSVLLIWHMQVGCEQAEIPSGPLRELQSFQLLLFVRCFQPRAFISAALPAIRMSLGPACATSEPFDLDSSFAVST